jgi:hypothetical protein
VTAIGNSQIDTAQLKFGTASGLFDGSGDFLTISDHNDFDFGTGDFTIDFWWRTSVPNSDNMGFYSKQDAGYVGQGLFFHWYISGEFRLYINGGAGGFIQRSASVTANTWNHVALVRSGNTWRIYLNGIQQGADFTSSANIDNAEIVRIGTDAVGTGYFVNGWIDEYRVSKGVARWASNFTPSSMEYSAPGSGTATVISNAYSEPTAPAEAIVIADETLNTGAITYYVSRDSGTTWTQCTKETLTSISSQPTGTQLKWKAVISGDAELNSIAVAV